jgi:acetoin utilization deacetylase AcuC-like enzyme/GNAT superfamily N-acetyltransferase
MFRIRRIYDDILPSDKKIIHEVQNILKTQFSLLSEEEINLLPKQLRNPLRYKLRSILFVADDLKGRVNGFAFIHHVSDLNFIYLDFMSAAKLQTGRGIGSALYEKVRDVAKQLKVIGIFFECLPDDPKLCTNPDILRQNIARLRFYERYGARPIINTKYETPLKPGAENPPYLVFDDLGQNVRLKRHQAQTVVRAILERKYAKICPKEYIDMVVNSFRDDPVQLRPAKYFKKEHPMLIKVSSPYYERIILVVTDRHEIHHIKERGYVEAPVRIKSILDYLEPSNLFSRISPKSFSEQYILQVHDKHYVNYFKRMCKMIPPGEAVYPYVFPLRHPERAPKELPIRAGYYCIDTFTPLTQNAYKVAKRAVDCALTAAQMLLKGNRLAYALVRPPGHHAEKKSFGGFCYLNSTAIAAHYLSSYGKVAILDIDYHHGNGTQDIFKERRDVLTISIHGHPHYTYPFFTGFTDEIGEGEGRGFNVNIPLPEHIDSARYVKALHKALYKIKKFQPDFLVVAFGLDTAKGDPTGTWNLVKKDFAKNGEMIASLHLPTLVVQEGGYKTRFLGINANCFFASLWSSLLGIYI